MHHDSEQCNVVLSHAMQRRAEQHPQPLAEIKLVRQIRVLGQRRRKAGSCCQRPARLHPGRTGQEHFSHTISAMAHCFLSIFVMQKYSQGKLCSREARGAPQTAGPVSRGQPHAQLLLHGPALLLLSARQGQKSLLTSTFL